MQDAVVKGAGNSRYLKSVPSFLGLYPTYEDFAQALIDGTLPVDFNGKNETGWQTMGTELNKANLLKDATAAAYGLTNSAVPDDLFAKLGTMMRYQWDRRTYKDTRVRADEDGGGGVVSGQSSTYPGYVEYSDSIVIADDDTVSLAEPTTKVEVTYNTYTAANVLKGKYWRLWSTQPTIIMYTDPSAQVTRSSTSTLYSVGIYPSVYVKIARSYDYGPWQHVFSQSRTAYPDSGIHLSTDTPALRQGYEYAYLGVPFDRIFRGAQIEYGYYRGTGLSGADNPTELVFRAPPKIVMVVGSDTEFIPGSGVWSFDAFIWFSGVTKTRIRYSDYSLVFTEEGNSLKYYSPSTTVMNVLHVDYKYVAIL